MKVSKQISILLLAVLACLTTSLRGNSQVSFEKFFGERSLRFDLVLAGNHESSNVYLDVISHEPFWGGSHRNLLDPFMYGNYRIQVWDDSTGTMIYSKGFCTYFEEWQTTAEAKSVQGAFDQVIRIPAPITPVRVEISARDEQNVFGLKLKLHIDPADPYIKPFSGIKYPFRKLVDCGDPEDCVDIAFIAEGYTTSESEKFYNDVKRLSDSLLAGKPFRDFRERFNIWAVEAVSEESGTDLPGLGIWKNTAVNSNFYTFKLERYLTTEDAVGVRDAAGNVPYDQVCVIVNTDKYGGGGIYNHYCVFSSDGPRAELVHAHEFGHSFAGLGDEYYSSDVAYEEFFKLDLEPWSPNLTTLVDFNSKWIGLLEDGTPVPTPDTEEFQDKTGVFEGGGYSARGIYRPAVDCRMNGMNADFCEVCSDAIIRMIRHHTE